MLLRSNLVILITTIIISLLSVQVQGKRGRYRFNHPPSTESVETVPVTVVYDSEDAREGKALKLAANFKATPEEESVVPKDDVKQAAEPAKEISSDVTAPVEKVEQKTTARKPLATRRNSQRNLQIPVNVVYETDLSNKENSSTSTPPKPRNQIRRRPQKPKVAEEPKEEVVVITNKQNDDQSSNDKTDFTVSTTTPKANIPLDAPENDQEQVKVVKRRRMRDPVVPIINEKNFVFSHSGNFHYSFEGGDGTKVFEEGALKTINDETGEAVSGGFSYTDKEGNDYSLSYTADENGYRPMGAHLPTPPPIPPAIARALAFLATKTTPQPVTESIRNFD